MQHECKIFQLFSGGIFMWYCNICMMLSMVPKECAYSLRCCADVDMWLLLRNASLWSLYRIVKDFPVCPTYASLQSGRISLYTADSENLSGMGFFFGMRRFLKMLLVRKVILISARLNTLVM
jgi:hypothetical protein